MYFRLNPEVYFIRGEKYGAIFDLIDAKRYALNQEETDIVTSCEKNNPVIGNEKFLHELKEFRLGNFYRNKVYIQKLRIGSGIEDVDVPYPFNRPELHRAFLEINNLCNRDCWFCGYHGIKRSSGCLGCNKWKENGKSLSFERWIEIIDELKDLDCRDIFVTGGDLTLVWDKTIGLLDYANGKFRNIYITLHQQSISSDKIIDLDKKAKLIVQTEDYNSIKMFQGLSALLVVKPDNLMEAIKINNKNVIKDFVVQDEKSLLNDHPLLSLGKASVVNMYKFLSNAEYHPCLGHTISVCNNGDVIPCPMMRNHRLGNTRDKNLYLIFRSNWEKINKFWRLNLDKIEKCIGCEFRYACNDCRALEESLTGRLEGKISCSYNPKVGEWGSMP